MIGQCGLTRQHILSQDVIEVGYLFNRASWHQGYATEAATACVHYAFERLELDRVWAQIRDTNVASMNVARRLGMTDAADSRALPRSRHAAHRLRPRSSGCRVASAHSLHFRWHFGQKCDPRFMKLSRTSFVPHRGHDSPSRPYAFRGARSSPPVR
jgi:RimJ/RimL family protein N-acetyltransferase